MKKNMPKPPDRIYRDIGITDPDKVVRYAQIVVVIAGGWVAIGSAISFFCSM